MKTKNVTKGFAKWTLALFLALLAVSVFWMRARVSAADVYSVKVDSGYLALRTAKAFDSSNEIGKLYTGDTVEVYDTSDAQYWYVYSSKLGKNGYVNKDYLRFVSSGSTPVAQASSGWTVKVNSGYLALRTAKAYDSANEIGELYTGDAVSVIDASDAQYWYVYSSKLNKYGYVNKDYLVGSFSNDPGWTVKVDSGYLALRTAKAFDSSNEIGELYTGDTVYLQDTGDSTYWYVYSPKLNKFGYVNKNYLISNSITFYDWIVGVNTGYLALRTAKAYDSSNEIGELYTGDRVAVIDASDSAYWYVYSYKLDSYGYVNKDYLVSQDVSSPSSVPAASTTSTATATPSRWIVKVDAGYLALRSTKVFDSSNVIGRLYSGDVVELYDSSDATYWYVYAPELGKYGYVNCKYLY